MSGVERPAPTASGSVAVVDNDERVREALVFQLNTAGFHVVSYPSAHEFLTAKNAGDFECVVADVFLPKMNGLELQIDSGRAAISCRSFSSPGAAICR